MIQLRQYSMVEMTDQTYTVAVWSYGCEGTDDTSYTLTLDAKSDLILTASTDDIDVNPTTYSIDVDALLEINNTK